MTNRIYVTVGATVPFPKLINQVISNLDKIILLEGTGNTEFIIQYGRNYTQQFIDAIKKSYEGETGQDCNIISLDDTTVADNSIEKDDLYELYFKYFRNKDNNNKCLYVTIPRFKKLKILGFELSGYINELLYDYQPNIIITHAGTGSLLDGLRLAGRKQKPKRSIICVINDELMDNHQVDIAKKFSECKYVKSCYPSEMGDLFKNMCGGNFPFSVGSGGDDIVEFPSGYNKQFENEVLLG
ncbi:uncharacterized protein SCODWIG_03804 [Saccharomycodes ludwigii]|uniref:UDP-N-acetylglucosamine transferase subunit ALG13 n=1 Tax=Saccharomycodes ludwigii TaxID=36035 RepID=A0A376BBH5_9ASCO|nr:uncharacterized protein SCODWIG_03804 [Saccharomycodes ludwigii]